MYNKMKYAIFSMVLITCGAGALAAPLAAKVNGVEITAQEVEDFNAFVSQRQGFKYKPGYAASELIARELLAQEAVRQGHDIHLEKSELAARVFNAFIAANTFKEADIRQEYERLKASTSKTVEYQLSAIVLNTEKQAQEVISNLSEGKPFALYVSQSIAENHKKNDGLMGWFEFQDLDSAFQIAVADLSPGAHYKKPVRASGGYAVVKLNATRNMEFEPYAALREDLIRKMSAERQDRLLKPLIEKASIERFPGYEAPSVWDPSKRR